jgi:hypothetical protein
VSPEPSPPIDDRPWCELRAHGRIIRYRCAGACRSVLALASSGAGPFWAALLAGLDGRCRDIAPEPPPPDTDLHAWLAALLEGLGTSGIRVIAGDRFHAPALRVVHEDPDRLAAVIAVSETSEDPVEAAARVRLRLSSEDAAGTS